MFYRHSGGSREEVKQFPSPSKSGRGDRGPCERASAPLPLLLGLINLNYSRKLLLNSIASKMGKQPIDRGWAWMCTLGAGVNMFFFIGILRSLGILMVDMIVRFNSSSALASAMLGLMGMGVSLTAPVSTAIGARYDNYRAVVILGALLVFAGVFLTSFGTSMIYVVLVFGILIGIGMGCIAGPAIVTVGLYFDKRRSLANGLATAGGSIGQLIIPLLFRLLLDTFQFQGGLMIFSAIALHMVPAALLLRPLSFYNRKPKKNTNKKLIYKDSSRSNSDKHYKENGRNEQSDAISNKNDYSEKDKSDHLNGKNGNAIAGENGTNGHVKLEENGKNGHANVEDKNMNGHSTKNGTNGHMAVSENGAIDEDTAALTSDYLKHKERRMSNISGPDEHHCRQRKISVYSSQMSLGVQPEPGKLPEGPHHAPWSQVFTKTFCCCCIRTPEEVVPLVTWRLLKSWVYWVYIVGVCLGNSGYLNACLFLPPYAGELGITKQTTAMMMAGMGIADLVSRILGGWFGDLGLIKRYHLVAITLCITGLVTMVSILVPSFASLLSMMIILGLLGGFYLSLMAVVLVDLMGLKNLSAGYGLTIMMQGIVNILLPTGLGVVKDATGSCKVSFVLCGLMMFLGGVSFFITPVAKRLDKRHKQPSEERSTQLPTQQQPLTETEPIV